MATLHAILPQLSEEEHERILRQAKNNLANQNNFKSWRSWDAHNAHHPPEEQHPKIEAHYDYIAVEFAKLVLEAINQK